MPETIKALSLWQPWASLMAVGAKKIETRSWPTGYRGLVAIHAAKKWDSELADICFRKPFIEVLSATQEWQERAKAIPFGGPEGLPRGCFIAVGRLSKCISTSQYPGLIPPQTSNEYHFGNYAARRFMWVFDEIWKLSSPVYSRGYQQLWMPEEDIKDVIFAMLPDEVEHGQTMASLEQSQEIQG